MITQSVSPAPAASLRRSDVPDEARAAYALHLAEARENISAALKELRAEATA